MSQMEFQLVLVSILGVYTLDLSAKVSFINKNLQIPHQTLKIPFQTIRHILEAPGRSPATLITTKLLTEGMYTNFQSNRSTISMIYSLIVTFQRVFQNYSKKELKSTSRLIRLGHSSKK